MSCKRLPNLLAPLVGLALLTGLVLTLPARAGTLDKGLLGQTGDVIAYLKENGYQNVGVLPFKVKRGNRPAQYDAGPLGTGIPRRLENALIMTMEPNEKRAIGVIRNAMGTANRAKAGAYTTSASAYKKLFALKYDLAWGSKPVSADAFLTGTVSNTGSDRTRTTVVVDLIDGRSWVKNKVQPRKSWTFTVRTDRVLLADLGYNFALSRSTLNRTWTVARRDQAATEQATRQDQKGDAREGTGQSKAHTPEDIAGFRFEIKYDGEKQAITPLTQGEGANSPDYQVPAPTPGKKITMHLTRTDGEDRRLGLVLMVNGKSSWKMEDCEPIAAKKWLYDLKDKDNENEWQGFYMDLDGKNLLPFRALTQEESEENVRALGERAGWIDVYVFASKEKGAPPPGGGDEQELVTTRNLGGARVKPRGLTELRSQLMAANRLREKKTLVNKRSVGGLILHEVEPVEGGTISTAELPNPELIGKLFIRYYVPSTGGTGGTTQP